MWSYVCKYWNLLMIHRRAALPLLKSGAEAREGGAGLVRLTSRRRRSLAQLCRGFFGARGILFRLLRARREPLRALFGLLQFALHPLALGVHFALPRIVGPRLPAALQHHAP